MPIETKPAKRPHWVYAPLVAVAIISVIPGVFAAIADLLSGGSPSKLQSLAGSMVLLPFMIALDNWPFLGLYFVTLKKARREWPSINSVRCAMWSSLTAMILPNLVLLLGSALFLFGPNAALDATLGYWAAIEFFVVPILAAIGWFLGRGIYHLGREVGVFAVPSTAGHGL
jgi:hypothetical protein